MIFDFHPWPTMHNFGNTPRENFFSSTYVGFCLWKEAVIVILQRPDNMSTTRKDRNDEILLRNLSSLKIDSFSSIQITINRGNYKTNHTKRIHKP